MCGVWSAEKQAAKYAAGYPLRLALTQALVRGARALDVQLSRAAPLRAPELAALATRMPALVEVPAACTSAQALVVAGLRGPQLQGDGVHGWPQDLMQLAVGDGFGMLKHLRERVEALGRMVYETKSEAVTEGVRVGVRSEFARYEAAEERFWFKYTVGITNERDANIKLLSRRWTIADLSGGLEVVEGLGVVGAFPGLRPGQSYSYSSQSPLPSPVGTQSGDLIFLRDVPDAAIGDAALPADAEPVASAGACAGKPMLAARVAPFALCTPDVDWSRVDGGTSGGGAHGSWPAAWGGAFGGRSSGPPRTPRADGSGSTLFVSGSKLRGPVAGTTFFPRGRRARRPKQRKR